MNQGLTLAVTFYPQRLPTPNSRTALRCPMLNISGIQAERDRR
jgi:hypothetical protein